MKKVFGITGMCGLLLVVGSVGALDHDTIGMAQCIYQTLGGIVLMAGSLFGSILHEYWSEENRDD